MLWLLQENRVNAMTDKVAWALRRMGRPFRGIRVPAGLRLWQPCDPTEPHFFYGSVGLLLEVQRTPHYAGNLFGTAAVTDQRAWLAHRQQDMLNSEVEFVRLGTLRSRLTRQTPAFFLRPAEVQKAFTGCVVERGDLAPVQLHLERTLLVHPDDLLVACSPLVRDIQAEYRFVVLDGHVRLGCRYRADNCPAVSTDVPADVFRQAAQLAKSWLPNRFTVMDVALLAGGRACIVEFNRPHTSGLYAIDPEAFVLLAEEAVADPRR